MRDPTRVANNVCVCVCVFTYGDLCRLCNNQQAKIVILDCSKFVDDRLVLPAILKTCLGSTADSNTR